MELLIRVIDKPHAEPPPRTGAGYSLAGDVIGYCPDGWGWSEAELTNPVWRIVRVPLTQIECEALIRIGDGDPNLVAIHKRKYSVDQSRLSAAARLLLSRVRQRDIIDLTGRVTEVRAAVIIKAALVQG
jgi:hypothetical protein